MSIGTIKRLKKSHGQFIVGTAIAVTLAACGGGGGSPGTVGGIGAGTGTGSGSSGSTITASTLAVTLVDGIGTSITSLSGGQTATVRAKFTDAKGVALANAIVKFVASDTTLVQFTPVSASALTDSSGTATINVKPVDFSSAGALSINATAVSGANSGAGSANINIGAAPLVVGTLSFTPTPSGALPAFNSLTLNIPVTSNGQPVTTAPGLTFSSLCKADNTATIVAGSVSNGIATATYTNTGCTRGQDVISVSIGNSSQTIPLSVSSANIGTINFISSNLNGTSLVLKGSGGLGRTESALLTFKVVDQAGTGLAGVLVNFTATTTTGGLKVLPAQATTDSNGNVQTSVQSGSIPTPVRVAVQASRNGATINGLSDALTISTGLPIQKAMSISADKYNIEGLDYDGIQANITIRMADQYGNPISDGAAINFVTEGGAVGSSLQGACLTLNGGCTVPLTSQSFRPVNGRVTVLAYSQGIEDFVDSNGDGLYSCANFTSGDGTSPVTFRPLIDTCVSGGEPYVDLPDAYLDTGSAAVLTKTATGTPVNFSYVRDLGVDGVSGIPGGGVSAAPLDGTYNPARGDLPFPYNHSTYSASGDNHWGINYIRRSIEIIFSGSNPAIVRVDPSTGDDFANPNDRVVAGLGGNGGAGTCSGKVLAFRLTDANNNPLPAGTTVTAADAVGITISGTVGPDSVLSTTAVGGTYHTVGLLPEATCATGSVNIVVTTPRGIKTTIPFRSN